MGFWGAVFGLLAGGYIVGIGTAYTVLRDRQRAYEEGMPERLDQHSLSPKPAFVRVPVRAQ